MIETFSDAVKFLEKYIPDPSRKFPGELGLVRMKKLMELLENPQDSYPTIHVGGTSGKGSTATFIASILSQKYKVGLHTSPHLVKVSERIVSGSGLKGAKGLTPISDKDFVNLFNIINPAVGEMERSELGVPSYFEIVTAMAFLTFQKENVDIAVIEVGMGGRYDATNVIKEPLVAIVTNVGLDHTEILGDTVEKIAQDKCGIIKTGIEVVSGVKQTSVIQIIREKCEKGRAHLSLLIPLPRPRVAKSYAGGAGSPPRLRSGQAVHPESGFEVFSYRIKRINSEGSVFDYFGEKAYGNSGSDLLGAKGLTLKNLRLSLLGEHQIENAALAIRAIEIIRGPLTISVRGPLIKEKDIRLGLTYAFIPGRLEIVKRNPLVILDGAHNEDKMKALFSSLSVIYPGRDITTIIAIKEDKRADEMLKIVMSMSKKVILTEFSLTTDLGETVSFPPEELKKFCYKIDPDKNVEIVSDIREAVDKAKRGAGEGLVLITGSLYLAGEVKKALSIKGKA